MGTINSRKKRKRSVARVGDPRIGRGAVAVDVQRDRRHCWSFILYFGNGSCMSSEESYSSKKKAKTQGVVKAKSELLELSV